MRLGYVIAYVPDVSATVDFFERAFGLARRFVDGSGNYAEMETGATALAFAQEGFVADGGVAFAPNRAEHVPAGLEVALVTANVEAAVTRAREMGAIVLREAERKPWGQTVAHLRDPNGILVEVCSPMG